MPHPIEDQLVTKLFQKTTAGQVDWQATYLSNQVTASFADKYIILLTQTPIGNLVQLSVKNADGDELSTLTGLQEPRLATLYELASRHARKEVEAQLADLLNEIDKPSSPGETQADRARLIDKIRREKGQ